MPFKQLVSAVCLMCCVFAAQAADWPNGYVKCANEHGTCASNTNAARTVSYGARDQWVMKQFSGSISCTNEAFGKDPLPGVGKFCANAPPPSSATVPAGYTKCSNEYETCAPGGANARMVAYGAQDKWVMKAMTGPLRCTNETFGTDPKPGIVKACANGPSVSGSDLPDGYSKCADEWQTCSPAANVSRRVAFGTKDRWTYKVVSGPIACTYDAFGNDPASGIVKVCANGPAEGTSGGGGSVGSRDYLKIKGTQLELAGKPFTVHSGVGYGWMSDPVTLVQKAVEAKVNTIELTNIEIGSGLNEVMSEGTWKRVDTIIAEAQKKGLKILLNFSGFYHHLAEHGYVPIAFDEPSYPYDWKRYIEFVAKRRNTVSGEIYATDPTIGMVYLVGEVDAPNYNNYSGTGFQGKVPFTTSQLTDFYSKTLAKLRSLDSVHIIHSGGFSYINDENAGIDWRAIMADPNNQIAAFEIYSFADHRDTAKKVAAYARSLGKPWFLAAWSSCYGRSGGDWDNSHFLSEDAMAAHAREMYELVRGASPADSPGVGSSVWALGPQGGAQSGWSETCDLGPQFPKVLSVMQEFAPQ